MTIVADESIDKQIVDRLRNDGHHVLFIAESEPSIDDEKVLLRSRELNGLLITADKDFGEFVFRQQLIHSGILLVRLAGLDAETKAALVSSTVSLFEEQLRGAFGVLTEHTVRIRPTQA